MLSPYLFFPIFIGIGVNLVLYLIYKVALEERFQIVINELIELESKLSLSSSEKRRLRKMKLRRRELESVYSAFRTLSFLQASTMMALYFIGFVVVATYFTWIRIVFPLNVPVLTNQDGTLNGGSVLLYILAFFALTPLGLRRPKLL